MSWGDAATDVGALFVSRREHAELHAVNGPEEKRRHSDANRTGYRRREIWWVDHIEEFHLNET